MTKLKPRRRLAIVLAAGEGTRMKSARPKVLHEIAGRTMLAHVLDAVAAAGANDIAVVVGPDRDDVAAEARKAAPGVQIFVQAQRLGTAHAVLAARGRPSPRAMMIFSSSTPTCPLIRRGDDCRRCVTSLAEGAEVAALGFVARDPAGYGRLIEKDGRLVAIREHKDASEAERAIAPMQRRADRHRRRARSGIARRDRLGQCRAANST